MDESLRSRVDQLARDRESGASELLTRALAILRDAQNQGSAVLVDAARAVCRAQPGMAPFWNAAVAALAETFSPGALDAFASRFARSSSALVRFAVQGIAGAPEERGRPLHVTTCSFSRSVVSCLEAVARVRPLGVACAEGRPALEGRRAATALASLGVQVDFYTDAGIALALAGTDALVVGADAVASEWFLNKCGTGPLAAACSARGVPVYVVASRDKFLAPALADLVSIEEHPPAEIWEDAPSDVRVRNTYFERVPLEWVTALVTDAGVLGVGAVPEVCRANGARVTPEVVAALAGRSSG
jgi:translation initiation factor eIF-2B subunit delta